MSCAAVVADPESLELVEPGERTLDDPAGASSPEPCSVWRRAITGLMPAAKRAAVLVVVVAAVGDSRSRRAVVVGRHGRVPAGPVDQREQLGDVVAVATG